MKQSELKQVNQVLKGGSGSGDFGHTGRPGKRGGSGGGGGKGKSRKGRRSREALGFVGGKVTNNVRNLDIDPNEGSIRKVQDRFYADDTSFHPDVASKIADVTGVDEILIEDFAIGWNGGNDFHKFAVINAINKELGIELSPYEKKNVNQWVDGATKIGLMDPNTLSDYKKIARATYDETQRQLKEMGITEVILYRGLKPDVSDVNKGDVVKWHGNLADSWTTVIDAAEGFAGLRNGMIIKSSIPANRVFSLSSSGPGTTSEREMVVLGNGPSDDVLIVMVN